MAVIDRFPGLDGHSCIAVGDYAVIYGGKTGPRTLNPHTFALELCSNDLRRLRTSGAVPRPRAYHTAVLWGWKMLVFGGLLAVGVDDIHYNSYNVIANVDALDEQTLQKRGTDRLRDADTLPRATQQKQEPCSLHALDLKNEPQWSELYTLGTVPPTRANHSAAVYRSTMYIFGGYSVHTTGRPTDEEVKACHLMYALDLNTMVWFVVEAQGGVSPPRRWGASSVLCADVWTFFGGVDAVEHRETNAVASWHMERAEWYWHADAVNAPQARVLHSAVRWGPKAIIFGGITATGCDPLNDLVVLDTVTGTWSEPEHIGDPPSARSGHAAVVIGESMYILGGFDYSLQRSARCWCCNLSTFEWSVVPTRFNPKDWTNIRGIAPTPSHEAAKPLKLRVVPRSVVASEAQTSTATPVYPEPSTTLDSKWTRGPIGTAADNKRTTAMRIPHATNPSSLPQQSHEANLESITSHIRRSRDTLSNMLLSASERAVREAQPFDEGPATAGGLDPSLPSSTWADEASGHLRSEVDARIQRLQDMAVTANTGSYQSAQGYWRNELDHLAEENERWRLAVQREHALLARAEAEHGTPSETQTLLRRLIMSGAPPHALRDGDPALLSAALHPHSSPSVIVARATESTATIHDASNPRYEPLRLVPRSKKYVSPSVIKLNLKLGASR